ncbi:MAG: R3H domain-containing nucleic acid-binding protein [Patescibacteria group bacterium]
MPEDLKSTTQNLLKLLGVTPEEIAVDIDETNSAQIKLTFSPEETGILIGRHADAISALQMILGLIVYRQTGTWQRLTVDIGDYRAKRTAVLETTAQETAKRVKFSHEPLALFNLNPFERRIVHMILSQDPGVVTESQGEGRNRHLIVKPAAELKDEA